MIWLRNPKLGGCRTWGVRDWRLKGCGQLELNIKDGVGDCKGAYSEGLIKIGPDWAENA